MPVSSTSVSYTHLDVYKRQGLNMAVQEDAVLAQKIAEMQKQFKVANISAAREKRYGVTVDDLSLIHI